MGQVYSELDDRLIAFIRAQPMFFVATAPSLDATGQGADGQGGHVNVSPKGYQDTFAVLDRLTVAYLDLTGSGAETIAHVRQNGRITIMFCSFDRAPKILRIYGTARIVLPADPEWAGLTPHFRRADDGEARVSDAHNGDAQIGGAQGGRGDERAIIVVAADRIADSCGYAVPVMELARERDLLIRWAENRTPSGLVSYRAERNAVSIDGLPALG